MRNVTSDTISQAFRAYAAEASSERVKAVLCGLADHLHAWVREQRLTHDEWRCGLDALTRAGQFTDDERNEFVLFSDMLGVSSLVDMVNARPGATSSSVLGPFHQSGAPALANGGDLWRGQPGTVLVFTGQVVDGVTGKGIAGATLDLWQNADNGFYSAADPSQPKGNYHGMLSCADDGGFCFSTTLFKPYTVPYDGPAGDMLRALGRDAWRPAHLHVIVAAPGYGSVVTELFPEGDEWLDRDAAFGVREDLVLSFEELTEVSQLPEGLEVRDRIPLPCLHARKTLVLARDGESPA